MQSGWKERGFLTLAEKERQNGREKRKLYEAIKLPKEIALIHCRAPRNNAMEESQGNTLGDSAAKATTRQLLIIGLTATDKPGEVTRSTFNHEKYNQ